MTQPYRKALGRDKTIYDEWHCQSRNSVCQIQYRFRPIWILSRRRLDSFKTLCGGWYCANCFWNCGGIIFYSDALDQTEDLLALSTYALAKQYMLRNGAALATRTLIPALSRIGILAAGTPVAESAEETDMFAISTLITIF